MARIGETYALHIKSALWMENWVAGQVSFIKGGEFSLGAKNSEQFGMQHGMCLILRGEALCFL
jgi:hypothetical protein